MMHVRRFLTKNTHLGHGDGRLAKSISAIVPKYSGEMSVFALKSRDCIRGRPIP